jgi:hypothetical protein
LKTLLLDRIFAPRSKLRPKAIESLISLISTPEKCPIDNLSLNGDDKSTLKQDGIPFLYAMFSNESITSLSINNHDMGDIGAAAILKLVQVSKMT